MNISNFSIDDMKLSIEDMKPVEFTDDKNFSFQNDFDEELEFEISSQEPGIINQLVHNMVSDCYDLAIGNDKFTMSKIRLTHGIKNIHRVRKGKRYIIKFDYTGEVTVEGRCYCE